MRYRALSATRDMTFGQGQKNFLINSPAAVAQAVETTLKLILGEWYLNLNDGTPYFQGILGVHSQETADQTLQSQIGGVQGVTGLENWKSTIDAKTRKYSSISATLFTVYGETKLQISNLGNF